MLVLEQIKKDQIQARKDQDKIATSILTVVIGECERVGKNCSDQDVVQVLKKLLKSNLETQQELERTKGPLSTRTLFQEQIILERYLPKQLTEDQIVGYIMSLKVNGQGSIKEVMAFFKENFPGQYDSKLVSQLAKG